MTSYIHVLAGLLLLSNQVSGMQYSQRNVLEYYIDHGLMDMYRFTPNVANQMQA